MRCPFYYNSRLLKSSSWLLEFFLSCPGLLALEEMLRTDGLRTDSLLRRDLKGGGRRDVKQGGSRLPFTIGLKAPAPTSLPRWG